MNLSISPLVKHSAAMALIVSLAAGAATYAAQSGLHVTTPEHRISVTTSDTVETLEMSRAATRAARPTTGHIRIVKSLGGIPPCREEDGSGQVGVCYWNDGTGDAIVNVPVGPNRDKRPVILVNR